MNQGVVGARLEDREYVRYCLEMSKNKEEWWQKSNLDMVDHLQHD